MSYSKRSSTEPSIVAVDQGTSSTKALAIAGDGSVLARANTPISQTHPHPGWVEQNAGEIFESVLTVLGQLLPQVENPVVSIGLSTQRESAIVWDRATGRPLGPMLGWQDRRTGPRAAELHAAGDDGWIRQRTGLPLDPMFSALKFEWLLDAVDPERRRASAGELALGTVDAFLAERLTGSFTIEAGNASRTQLLDLDRVDWDPELLECFRIPAAALPRIVDSNAHLPLRGDIDLGRSLGVDAILGDSHAALYGHGVRAPGPVKVTYGTGSSVMGLLDAGARTHQSSGDALARTLAWQLSGAPTQAFEGNILATGATLVWLGELLAETPAALFELARAVDSSAGVELVPAFAGLAAPWWSEQARATLTGFTLGTSRATVARAGVDSIVLQIEDVLAAAEREGASVATVLADGGPSANDWLMQLQADYSGRRLRRSPIPDLSAFGAAWLAASGAGIELTLPAIDPRDEFEPRIDPEQRETRARSWHAAVARALETPPVQPAARPVHPATPLTEGAPQ